jgi:hypothetical protein
MGLKMANRQQNKYWYIENRASRIEEEKWSMLAGKKRKWLVQYNLPNKRDENIQNDVVHLSNKLFEGSGHCNVHMLFLSSVFFLFCFLDCRLFYHSRQDGFCWTWRCQHCTMRVKYYLIFHSLCQLEGERVMHYGTWRSPRSCRLLFWVHGNGNYTRQILATSPRQSRWWTRRCQRQSPSLGAFLTM